MAYTGNILEEHAPSPIAIAVDGDGKPKRHPNVLLQCLSTTLKDDVESWGKPRTPLRRPLYVPPDVAREQLEGPRERRGSCIPVNSLRALKHPYGSPPAVAKESLATGGVNSSEVLAGWSPMGHDSINVSQKFPGGSHSMMIEGARVSNESAESEVNYAKFHLASPQGQGSFPFRGPLIKDSPPIPTIRSGIMMELPSGNMRMVGNERMAHVSFPVGSPWNPTDNGPRPITVPPSVSRACWFPSGPCFIPPGPPISHPFLNLPMPFPPPMYRPPLLPYFGNFPSSEMPLPPCSNSENQS